VDFTGSGAGLIVVVRGSKIAHALVEDASFRNLDGLLFSPEESSWFPLQVFGPKQSNDLNPEPANGPSNAPQAGKIKH
jgi:hypothetical protein